MSVNARTPAIRRTPVSLQLNADLPLEEWRQIGVELANVAKRTPWWLGDWLFYGETKYGSQTAAYDEAVAATGLDRQTLYNYKMVAGRFAFSRRRETLTLAHHLEVIALDLADQEAWLDRAVEQDWTRQALRDELHQRATPRERAQLALVPLRVEEGRLQRWRDAAAAVGMSDKEWAALELDRAAQRVLEPAEAA